MTFHNQRDFIFVRHHRYIYRKDKENKTYAKLQELGPRFTLKLKWIQAGSFIFYIYHSILILMLLHMSVSICQDIPLYNVKNMMSYILINIYSIRYNAK